MIQYKLTFFLNGRPICHYEGPADTQFRATLPPMFIGADEVMFERVEDPGIPELLPRDVAGPNDETTRMPAVAAPTAARRGNKSS